MAKAKVYNLVLLLISFCISFVLAELALRTWTPFPIHMSSGQQPHDELLYVLHPSRDDIDTQGFRNPQASSHPEIYAIGDSHTYGSNVTWDKSWPHQLGEFSRKDVYNFGVGSYGIYQYVRLFEMAVERAPSFILVGLYPANDLTLNGCRLLHLEYWKERALQQGLSNGFCEEENPDEIDDPGMDQGGLNEALKSSAVINAIYFTFIKPVLNYPGTYDFSDGATEISVNRKRVAAHHSLTDLDRDKVRQHFANGQILFRYMQELAASNDIPWGVLLVPSKERVIFHWATANDLPLPESFREAVESEERLVEILKEFFDEESIMYSDAAPRMVDLLAQGSANGSSIYKSGDGHPFDRGYDAYAQTAADLMSAAERR